MIARLNKDKEFPGFTQGKEYEYYEQYITDTAKLNIIIRHDDNDQRRMLNDREFSENFIGQYKDNRYFYN